MSFSKCFEEIISKYTQEEIKNMCVSLNLEGNDYKENIKNKLLEDNAYSYLEKIPEKDIKEYLKKETNKYYSNFLDLVNKNKDNYYNLEPINRYDQLNTTLKNEIFDEKSTSMVNINCHLGQRKLLLSEIEFYAKCIDKKSSKQNIVIYAGSASGEHTPIILDMFQNMKFIFIDPNYHCIDPRYKFSYLYQNSDVISESNLKEFLQYSSNKNIKNDRAAHLKRCSSTLLDADFFHSTKNYNVLKSLHESKDDMKKIMKQFYVDKNLETNILNSDKRVFIIQDYMTLGLSEKLRDSLKNSNIYFLTDIRTAISSSHPVDLDFLWNYALQIIYIKTLNPIYSMLKFRPIYFYDKDSELNKNFDQFYTTGVVSKNDEGLFKTIKFDLDYVKDKYGLDMYKEYLNNKFYYFDSDFISLQAWMPSRSRECRMFVSRESVKKPFVYIDEKEWDYKLRDNLNYIRSYGYFPDIYEILRKNGLSGKFGKLDYDGCFDCMRELVILGEYFVSRNNNEKFKVSKDIDLQKILKFYDNKDNLYKLKKLYDEIKKYTFFDLSHGNFKCSYHPHTYTNPENIIFNFISLRAKLVYGYSLNEKEILYYFRIPFGDKKEELDYEEVRNIQDYIIKNYNFDSNSDIKWYITGKKFSKY